METLGQKIFKLRQEKHLSQEELGFELGVSRLSVHKWEKDLMQPNLESIRLLCNYFKVDLNYFFDYGDSTEIKEIATTNDEIEVKNKNGKSKICLIFVIILSVMLALSLLVFIIFSVIKFTSNTGVASASSTVYNDGVFYGSLSISIVLALLLIFLIIYMVKIKK